MRSESSPVLGSTGTPPAARSVLRLVAVVVAGVLAPGVAAADQAGSAPGAAAADRAVPARPAAPAPGERYENIVVEHGVELRMRDGVVLRATVVRPDAPGRFPTIVYRTPYGARSYSSYAEFPRKAAKAGYLVFLVDVRGRYASDGEFHAYRQEREDGYDTIEAAASHPRSNGRVGTYGGSYPGFDQWLALAEEPPHLVTAVPDMTPVGSHHFFYVGGAASHSWYDWFMPLILPDMRRRAGDRSGPWTYDEASAEWEQERMKWLTHRPLVDVPLLREYAPYYYDWLTHPDETDWWDFVDVEDEFDEMAQPVMMVTGWYDNTYGVVGATRGFVGMRANAPTREAREATKMVIGPWRHSSIHVHQTETGDLDFGPSAGLDFDARLLRWFDRRLNGVRNGIDGEPPVLIFVMGENRWRYEEEWPIARAEARSMYLRAGAGMNGGGVSARGDGSGRHGGGRVGESDADADTDADGGLLSFAAPTGSEAADTYTFDPNDPVWDHHYDEGGGAYDQAAIESRDDVLLYTSPPLEEPIEVTGQVEVELYVSADVADTDLAVMITDVHPDGTSYNLTGPEAGYLRLRYRGGYDEQVLMEPGEIYQVRVGSLPTSNLFKRGHRIRIQVTSSRMPHFAPNPNTGTEIATEDRLVPARVTIHHDAEHRSRVILPVVPRGGGERTTTEVDEGHAAATEATEAGAGRARTARPERTGGVPDGAR